MNEQTSNSHNNNNNYEALIKKIQHLEEINLAISHNLRGGLGNIKQLSELLMEKKTNKRQLRDSPKGLSTAEGLQYILDSSISLLATLNSFLDLSGIHTRSELKCEECDVKKIVQQITAQLQAPGTDRDAMQLFLAVTHIKYPALYLESILYNLISNALKYSRPGVPPEISVITYCENGRPMLKVKDNGLGINLAANKNKLFKLHQTFHRGYDSRGVGLYMTKMQIESMGGSITVKSIVNEGSEFTVMF